MHELSIALSILDFVEAEAVNRGNARVQAVHLKLGPLSGVVKEALESAYQMACEGTALAETRLEIEDQPLTIHCSKCRQVKPAESIWSICCAECGTPAMEIASGNELEITALEIEE